MRRRTLIGAATSIAAPFLASNAFSDDAGVGDRELSIGQSAVLSGPLGLAMKGFNFGAQLAFDQVNAQGGVHGRRIRLVSLDDELKPEQTVLNYKKLLAEQRVLALFGGVGSANIAAAVPVLQESNAPLIGSYALSDSARAKAAGAAYFVRAGYGREAERHVQHLASLGIERIAVAHLAVRGGEEVLEAVRVAIKARDTSRDVVQAVPVKTDGSNAADAGRAIAAGAAQAVIMFLSGPPVADMIRTAREAGANPLFHGMSSVAGEQVAQTLGKRLQGLAISQVVPFPWNDADPTARQLAQLSTGAGARISYYSFEGYINALVLIEALRRAGRAVTRSALHSTMRALKARIGGMDLDFTAGAHTGSRFVELVYVTADARFVR
jgi:ABC-type branched-subunit amino acid transport system substrate-binding protein